MTETYTQTISSREAAKETLIPDDDRLDVDDRLFYEMLRSELDALLRQPRSRSVNRIISYSRAQRMPLM